MALDLQQRPPEHGHRRHHTRPETENGRVSSTSAPRQKWGDYHSIEEEYAECDLILTSRFHGAIAAMRQGVPFVAIDQIASGGKVYNLLSDLGWEHVYRIVDADTDQIMRSALDLLGDPQKDKLLTAYRYSVKSANHTLSKLVAHLSAK